MPGGGGGRRELELERGLERGVGGRDACERCTSERGSSGGGGGTGELERGGGRSTGELERCNKAIKHLSV